MPTIFLVPIMEAVPPLGSEPKDHDEEGARTAMLRTYYVTSGVRVIPTEGIGRGRILSDVTLPCISEQKAVELARHRLVKGDILFARRGIQATGLSACVEDEHAGALCGTGAILLRVDQRFVNPKFLAASLATDEAFEWLRAHAVGAVMPNLNTSIISALSVRLPPIDVQISIGNFVGTLDDRIDLLRETNTTLEAIAQTLFKSWFVDFDPVRAKAEGREPEGMDAATAALFPSEFEESELGLIPKRWNVGTFADIAFQSKGSVSPLKSPETEYEHYSLPAFDAGLMPVRQLGEAIKSNKTPVPDEAILISKLNPHIPRIWFTGKVHANAICSTEFLVWTAARGMTAEYVFCLAVSTPFNTAMKQLVTGTSNSHQRVKPDHLKSIPTVIPTGGLAQAFETFVEPLFHRIQENRLIGQSLGHLRDTLLPRLISGKLRLPEAETMLDDNMQSNHSSEAAEVTR